VKYILIAPNDPKCKWLRERIEKKGVKIEFRTREQLKKSVEGLVDIYLYDLPNTLLPALVDTDTGKIIAGKVLKILDEL
jgi:hypothetical protein